MNFQTVKSYTSEAFKGALVGGTIGACYGACLGSCFEVRVPPPGCLQYDSYSTTIAVYSYQRDRQSFDNCISGPLYLPGTCYAMIVGAAIGATGGALLAVAKCALTDLVLYHGNKGEGF